MKIFEKFGIRAALVLLAAVGIGLMLFGGKGKQVKEKENTELEEKFKQAILMMDGVDDADVIITEESGKPTGAAVVCNGGDSETCGRITKLMCSGLNLSANKIYVVCN